MLTTRSQPPAHKHTIVLGETFSHADNQWLYSAPSGDPCWLRLLCETQGHYSVCQLDVLVRVSWEGKGLGLLGRRGLVLFLRRVAVLCKVGQSQRAGCLSLAAFAPSPTGGGEWAQMTSERATIVLEVVSLLTSLLGQGSIDVLFTIVSPA